MKRTQEQPRLISSATPFASHAKSKQENHQIIPILAPPSKTFHPLSQAKPKFVPRTLHRKSLTSISYLLHHRHAIHHTNTRAQHYLQKTQKFASRNADTTPAFLFLPLSKSGLEEARSPALSQASGVRPRRLGGRAAKARGAFPSRRSTR
jgi:hypothetical protein